MRAALIALTLSACAQSYDTVTPVGDSFEGTWSEEIARAAQEWTDVGCPVYVQVDGVPVSLVGVGDYPWEPNLWGYYTGGDEPKIFIRNSLGPDARHSLLLHEMGHMLGFGHSDHGIMTAVVTQDHVTVEDCR